MYTSSSGQSIYCDGPMTKSAKEGVPAATTGCTGSGGTGTAPSGQKEQTWNALGLRSWIRTDADAVRIDSLKQACVNVPNGANVWLPGSGDSTSVDFGMPSTDKCRIGATCTSGQYFDGASCVTTTTTGGTMPIAPSGLTAVQSQTDAILNWSDNSINENEYKIERRITGGASWTYVGGAGIVYGGSGTYRDYYPPAGSYDYRVRACNSAGCSESNTVLLVMSTTSTVAQCSDGKDNDNDGSTDYPADTSCYDKTDNDEFYPSSQTTNCSSIAAQNTCTASSGCQWNAPSISSGAPSYCSMVYVGDAGSCPGFAYSKWDSQGKRYCQLNNYIACQYNYPQYIDVKNYDPANCSSTAAAAQCSDGRDNDGDGLIDYPSDTGCYSRDDNDETVPLVGGGIPSTPSGLTAALASNGYDIILRWGDTATNESEYKIWRRLGTSWSFLVSIGIAYGGTVTHTDLSMPAGYTGLIEYKVQACNSSGCSPDSNTASVNVGTVTTAGCDNALIALLGSGCHQMYTDSSGSPVFCNGNMTTSAKKGDTVVTQGCSSSVQPVSTTFSVDPYSTYPRDQESGVSTLIRIRVNFTREIDPASTIAQFFSLAPVSSPTNLLNGTFQFFGSGFDFTSAQSLNSNTTYIYKVFTTLKDKGGASLSAPLTRTFTTVGGASANATIDGSVQDAGGLPLSGVSVNIIKEDYSSSISVVSIADGSFRAVISPGNYWIEAYIPSGRSDLLRPTPVKVTVASGASEKVTIKFNSITTAAKSITGTVKFSNGNAVGDAEVSAYSVDTYQWISTSPDSKGNYTLRVAGGKWKIGIRPKNPATATWSYYGPHPEVSFAKDNSSDFQIVDFTVPVADATLKVLTLDAQGKPLSDVGVVVDTFSAGQENLSSGISGDDRGAPQYRSSDASGVAKFTLVSGRYHVRAYLPPTKGYLNTPEKEVTVSSGKTVDLSLTFLKRDAISTLLFKGVIKLEEGVPTDAFVWAWSEKGGYISTFSSDAGLFEFKVGSNERWHIGAGKVVNGVPYKASEVVVEVKEIGVNVELILAKLDKSALPPPVVIRESSSKQIVVQAEDGAKAVIPPNAAGSGNISVEVKPTLEAPSQAGAQVVGTVYDVNIHDSAGKEITTLNSDVEIIIPYDEAELKAKGVGEDAVLPSFFDEKTGTWVKVDNYTIDKEKNIVILRVKHLTRFGLVASTDTTPPAPPTKVAVSALGEGKVKITWQNPTYDFSYAKVYRNDQLGELGKIVASEVKGGQYTDNSVADKVTYYYTIRSTDPAGNESNNKDQVSVKAVGTSGQAQALGKPVSAVSTKKGGLSRNLSQGARNDDVKTMQGLLIKEGFLPADSATGFFGKLTREAVVKFQEKYAADVLKPAGLTKGNGFIGPGTRKKLNELLAR